MKNMIVRLVRARNDQICCLRKITNYFQIREEMNLFQS